MQRAWKFANKKGIDGMNSMLFFLIILVEFGILFVIGEGYEIVFMFEFQETCE